MVPCMLGWHPACLDGALFALRAALMCVLNAPTHAKLRQKHIANYAKNIAQPVTTTGARTRCSQFIEQVCLPLDQAAKKMLAARRAQTGDLLLKRATPLPTRPRRTW